MATTRESFDRRERPGYGEPIAGPSLGGSHRKVDSLSECYADLVEKDGFPLLPTRINTLIRSNQHGGKSIRFDAD